MLQFLKKFIFANNQKDQKIQTFTYYIPAPPPRTSGYREKQFDKVFYEFINKGYEIIDFKTESHTSDKSQGLWLIFLVRSTHQKSAQIDLDSTEGEKSSSKSSSKQIQLEEGFTLEHD